MKLQIKNLVLETRVGKGISLDELSAEMSMFAISKLDSRLGKDILRIEDVSFNNLPDYIKERLVLCNTYHVMVDGTVIGTGGVVYRGKSLIRHMNVIRFETVYNYVYNRVSSDLSSRIELRKNHGKVDAIPKWFGSERPVSETEKDLASYKTGKKTPLFKDLTIPGKSIRYKLFHSFYVNDNNEVGVDLFRVPIIDGVAYVKRERVKLPASFAFMGGGNNGKWDVLGYESTASYVKEMLLACKPIFRLVEMGADEIRDRVRAKDLGIAYKDLLGKAKEKAVNGKRPAF